jgi:hypothetical protein
LPANLEEPDSDVIVLHKVARVQDMRLTALARRARHDRRDIMRDDFLMVIHGDRGKRWKWWRVRLKADIG